MANAGIRLTLLAAGALAALAAAAEGIPARIAAGIDLVLEIRCDGETLIAIDVSDAARSAFAQSLAGFEDTGVDRCIDGDDIEVADVNFDGHADLGIVEFHPAGPNVPYLFWIWNAREGGFERSRALEAITSPEFDPQRKEIRSFVRDGAARYFDQIYRWVEGSPRLEREIETVYEPDLAVKRIVERAREGGEMIVVEEREEPL